jgi:hypothetical protein
MVFPCGLREFTIKASAAIQIDSGKEKVGCIWVNRLDFLCVENFFDVGARLRPYR